MSLKNKKRVKLGYHDFTSSFFFAKELTTDEDKLGPDRGYKRYTVKNYIQFMATGTRYLLEYKTEQTTRTYHTSYWKIYYATEKED